MIRTPRCDTGHFKTHLFPATFLGFSSAEVECRSKSDPKVREFGFGGFTERVHVVERDERIISACVSTRENGWCGEAWARELLKIGKVPFYSHKMENSASANLATRLGLQPVFEEFVISYA